MFLDGTKEKKRGWCRSRSAKTKPPTAMLTSRHGNIEAMLRVVGESALRSVATINTVTRSGDIVIDLVSLKVLFSIAIHCSDLAAGLHRSYEDGAHRCKVAQRCVGSYFLNTGLFDADCPVLQARSLSSFHEISAGLSSSRPVMVRWNYFPSWLPPVA